VPLAAVSHEVGVVVLDFLCELAVRFVFRTLAFGVFEVGLSFRDFLLALVVLVVDPVALRDLLGECLALLVIKSRLVVLRPVLLELQLLLDVVQVVLVHLRKQVLRLLPSPQQLRRHRLHPLRLVSDL
jgi:hypothetical protein